MSFHRPPSSRHRPAHAASGAGDRAGRAGYFPYLDSLRFFVILGVMLVAYIHQPYLEQWWLTTGVRSFFLLSGFFGTMVITRVHAEYEDSPRWLGLSLLRYYTFRIFRIFPVYYAIVLGALVLGMEVVREHLWWFLTFTQNLVPTVTGESLWIFGHFWSLAVLEHFYLLFPLVFLLARRRAWAVPALALAAIVTAVAFRAWAAAGDIRSYQWLLPAQWDAFACGVLIGVLTLDSRLARVRRAVQTVPAWAQLLGAASLFVGAKFAAMEGWLQWSENTRLLVEIVLVAVAVRALTEPQPRPLDVFLRQRWLCHLGVVSYGMYAFKNFADWALAKPFGWLGLSLPESAWLRVPLFTGFTIVCALLSWHCFEKHVLARRARIVDALLRLGRRLRGRAPVTSAA